MTIPTPELGLVVSYAYLWHHEHLDGQEEGRKNRPGVIVLLVERPGDRSVRVTVLPITHTPPKEPDSAVEIPALVKRHLRLDGERSWIVISEGNEFLWPGYDLVKIPASGDYHYGFLPPRLFERVLKAFVALTRSGRSRRTSRD